MGPETWDQGTGDMESGGSLCTQVAISIMCSRHTCLGIVVFRVYLINQILKCWNDYDVKDQSCILRKFSEMYYMNIRIERENKLGIINFRYL